MSDPETNRPTLSFVSVGHEKYQLDSVNWKRWPLLAVSIGLYSIGFMGSPCSYVICSVVTGTIDVVDNDIGLLGSLSLLFVGN